MTGNIHFITGARLTDQVFTITLMTGETVTWNITKLNAAAVAGAFGGVRYAATADLPPANWTEWGADDRATIEWIKADPATLDAPAIAIASPNPDFAICCFADGQHRITARQELGLAEISFWLVPLELERQFRIEGLTP
jgi:hypothetical protein